MQRLRHCLQKRERGAVGYQPTSRRNHQRRKSRRALRLYGLHALHRRALRGGVPCELLLHHGRCGGAALERSLHRVRLLLLRLPVRRAAISEGRKLRVARQDGQVHVLRRRPGSRWHEGRVREIRCQPAGRRQAALVRRDVLDQVAARRRQRRHSQIYKERVSRRGYGSGAWGWQTAYRESIATLCKLAVRPMPHRQSV